MPQFDKYLLVTLVITITSVFGVFYFLFLNSVEKKVKIAISIRERLKKWIKDLNTSNQDLSSIENKINHSFFGEFTSERVKMLKRLENAKTKKVS